MAAPSPLNPLYIEALKSVAVTLGQMNLYQIGHPSVTTSIRETMITLTKVLGQVHEGEIVYAIDGGKLIANGQAVGALNQVPNSVAQLFNRFRLHSLTFKRGIEETEITALCEMASIKAENAKALDAVEFIKQRKAEHIGINEVIYAAISDKDTVVDQNLAEALGGKTLSEQIKDNSLEESLRAIIKMAVPDPQEQDKVFGIVMERVRGDLENKVREVTDPLKKEKMKLQNEQVRTNNVLSNMAEGVVVVDEQGRVLMMNGVAEEIYGVKLKDIAGQPLTKFVKEEHLVTLAQELETPEDRNVKGSVDIKAKGDTLRTLRASTAVVQNEAGKTVGMVSAISDKAKHRELERMEREFIAHVTHELRAPLSSIRASLEILQGEFTGKLEEDQSRMLNTALKNADRLDDLIKNILDFSKIESGQMTVYPKPAEPAKMAQEAVESMQPWCIKKGLKLSLDIESGLPKVDADSGRVVQVLVNLLSNAIKFSPQGGKISVRVARGTDQFDRFVQFSVKDEGPGIPKQEQARIFEKFVQIAAGEKNVGGTGLGLAIAKALMHLHKGQLWVESDGSKGSLFNFTLPVHVATGDEADYSVHKKKAPWWKRLFGLG